MIVKPDGVERGLVGQILARLEAKGLTLVAAELRAITSAVAEVHYSEHAGKPFYADLVGFITRSPALVMVVEGPGETYRVVRTLMGATNPVEAAPGTIRGDLAVEMTENLVHGSDSPSQPPARSPCSSPTSPDIPVQVAQRGAVRVGYHVRHERRRPMGSQSPAHGDRAKRAGGTRLRQPVSEPRTARPKAEARFGSPSREETRPRCPITA